MNVKILLSLILFCFSILYSAEKYEFRGAWIATVKNIDWPSSPDSSVEAQKNELIKILDILHQVRINAILFQVRTECDAFYESEREPWSFWLTGQQGKAPKPHFDPLDFIIKETHKRGMELHAWFNPIRAGNSNSTYLPDSSHITIKKPDWIIHSENYKFLNPGIREVRDYTTSIIMDVVKRYDIDGVHFDDYFYPYSGISQEDLHTYKMSPRGIDNIGDWRRDNVNLLVKDVYEKIKMLKPYLKFGISPFGIWKDGTPEGITGTSSYYDIYCDATYWLKNNIVDYIIPQLYWKIGGDQDYAKLSEWWSGLANGRHVYAGHALYKMNGDTKNWSAEEISNQIEINQNHSKIVGSVFFRSIDIVNNIKGIADTLKNNSFKYMSIVPRMSWIDSFPPLFPFNLTATSCADGVFLQWYNPVPAQDGDDAKFNVVYRFESDDLEINDPKNIIAMIPAGNSSFTDTTGIPNQYYNYIVTALDKMQNESNGSNVVKTKYTQIESYPGAMPLTTGLLNNDTVQSRNNTVIKFNICEKELVKLTIFDNRGNNIITLVEEELLPGRYGVKFRYLPNSTGKYHCNLSTPTFSDMQSLKIGNHH